MNDLETLKQYMNCPDQQVYHMIGELTPKQWDAFCEALNKLEHRDVASNLRRALFIARSYPTGE